MRMRAIMGCCAMLAGALGVSAAPPGDASLDLAAEILALRDVRVPAEVAGRVIRRPENETTGVQAGEVVVALDDVFLAALARAARASADGAQARAEWAQRGLQRVQSLFEKETVGEAELDGARLKAREASATLASAEALADEAARRLERAQIVAPFTGKLVRVYPERGEYLRVGETAFRIVDDSALRIIAYVPANHAGRLAPGQAVLVLVAPERSESKLPVLRAKVFSVAPAAEGAARTIRVEARAEDASGRWRPGMTARLRSTAAAKDGKDGNDGKDGKDGKDAK